jgi:hypothetical protein
MLQDKLLLKQTMLQRKMEQVSTSSKQVVASTKARASRDRCDDIGGGTSKENCGDGAHCGNMAGDSAASIRHSGDTFAVEPSSINEPSEGNSGSAEIENKGNIGKEDCMRLPAVVAT